MDSKGCVLAARSGFVERKWKVLIIVTFGAVALLGAIVASAAPPSQNNIDAEINRQAQAMIDEGRKIFRYDTFGSEAFWGDALQLHKAIAGEKNGGIGPGVSQAHPLQQVPQGYPFCGVGTDGAFRLRDARIVQIASRLTAMRTHPRAM